MGTTYQDGVLQFGTQLVTLGALTNLIADDIDIEDPTTVLTRKDNNGIPAGEVLMDGVMTGTATLQMPGATIALPAKGTHFTLVDVTGTTLPFKVEGFGRKFKSDGETKIPLKFRQRFATGA